MVQITADVPVTLQALAVTGGKEVNGDDNPGAGMYTKGDLTLIDILASGNHATSANSAGGGIYSTGTLTLRNTVVRENSSRYGGGIHVFGGSLTLESGSTVRDNKANELGGAIFTVESTVTVEDGALICDNSEPQCYGDSISGTCPDSAICPP